MSAKKMKMKKGKMSGNGDYVMKSRVKDALRGFGCNSSGDVVQGLNMVVGWYLQQAAARAKMNRRVTVRAHDFIVP
jgi:hypothetical protein